MKLVFQRWLFARRSDELFIRDVRDIQIVGLFKWVQVSRIS